MRALLCRTAYARKACTFGCSSTKREVIIMKICLINVSLTGTLRDDLERMAREYGSELEFEDVLGYRDGALINTSLTQEALKVAKVHAEVSRLTSSYLVRDIASGIVSSEHNIVEDKGMRIARDLIKYSELDIERVVRSGLEVSRASRALVVTKSNVLITSRVWQRLSAEVGADYNARVDFVEIDDFILGYNLYIEKYPLILVDSLFGDIVSNILTKLGEVKEVFFTGESESFYTTDGSERQTALAIYEILKEKYPEFTEHIKGYFDKYAL